MKWFKQKRSQVQKTLPRQSLLLLASAPECLRQPDVYYPYRQDSFFYYLTGFVQPQSLLVLEGSPKGKSILFIQNKSPVKELWDGQLLSVEKAKKNLLVDEVYYLSDLDRKLPSLFKNKTKVYMNSINSFFNRKIRTHYKKNLGSAESFLTPFREIKDQTEVNQIQKAISATAYGHREIALHLKPQVNERHLHGVFLKSIMEKGAEREGYGAIVASGNQACTIHYIQNQEFCQKGELLLVDAGAEMGYYTADVTRVYPVSGRFSKNQKILYGKLLKLQKQLIKLVKPGRSMKEINLKMKEGIVSLLLEMKILKGSLASHLKKNSAHDYCPHSVGHLLGLDVHDCFSATTRQALVLKKGMVLTIEPGVYISNKNKSVPADLRGVGLRIEDNILVTAQGQKNLTQKLPKEVKDIEKLCLLKKKS